MERCPKCDATPETASLYCREPNDENCPGKKAFRMDRELWGVLYWLAKHELWTDVYPDGPEQPRVVVLPPEHVKVARKVLGMTAADFGYHPSKYAAKLAELDNRPCQE